MPRDASSVLSEHRAIYLAEVARHATSILAGGAAVAWLLAPVAVAHGRRRNFFRSALLMASARAAGNTSAAPTLAACGELGWTCALVVDDMLDRSTEREGSVAAHVQFGALRSALAVAVALLRIASTLGWRIPGAGASTRLRWISLGVQLVARAGIASVLPSTLDMSRYIRHARAINCSLEWALTSPHRCSRNAPICRALRQYASHCAVAGRMKNDIADYWGGSSERDVLFEDFRHRRMTLPVLVLLGMSLTSDERAGVLAHFASRSSLEVEALLALFKRYRVLAACIGLIESEVREAGAALHDLDIQPGGPTLSDVLAAWNRHMLQACSDLESTHS